MGIPTPSLSSSSTPMLHSLLAIQSATENMQLFIQSRLQKEPAQIVRNANPNISIPVLDLSFSSDLDATLRSMGLRGSGHSVAHRKIEDWIHRLQDIHSRNFQRSCLELASLPHFPHSLPLDLLIQHTRLAYEKKYASYLPFIKARILSAQPPQNSICRDSKTPFNNEYTPLLELYFQQNAYPSLPDRKLLAKKSMMSMRQIEVWFQNHRARARKEGKVVKKLDSPYQHQPQLNLKSIKQCAPSFSLADFPIKRSVDNLRGDRTSEDEASTTLPLLAPCSFSQGAPPHAFPATYPPNLTTDPFPNENGRFSFPAPIWRRTSTQPKTQTAVLDMDEFISMFASKLHLRDGSRRKCDFQQSQNTKIHKKSWFSPMAVVPAPAPHPALIRAPYISLSGTNNPPSKSSAPLNSSSTLPVSSPSNPHRPRKSAPFSKRTPSAFSANHASDRPTAFSAFASRESSLSSVASSQSRSSSSSSLLSTELATPPLSPTHQQDPVFTHHDYQLLDELFGPEPLQLLNDVSYATHDFLLPTISLKDLSHNPPYDLSSMFPPTVAQVLC